MSILFLRAVWGTLRDMSPHYVLKLYMIMKSVLWDAPQRFCLDIELEYLRLKRVSCHIPKPDPEPKNESMVNTLLSRYSRIYK